MLTSSCRFRIVRQKEEGEGELTKAERIYSDYTVPRYIIPDASEPDYEIILEQIQQYRKSQIGSSYYYIRTVDEGALLCRILPGGGKVFFHEVMNPEKYGISEEDIAEAVKSDPGTFSLPGLYHISPFIEQKLRSLLEFE